MGNFSPNTGVLGMQSRPSIQLTPQLTVNNAGFLGRFRGQAGTIDHVHTYLQDVEGSPGLGIEIIDELAPTPSDADYFPGTNTDAIQSQWEDFSSNPASFTNIDDKYDDGDGLRNIDPLNFPELLYLWYRGVGPAITGKRVDRFEIWARVTLYPGEGSSGPCRVRGIAWVGGNPYSTEAQQIIPVDGLTYTVRLANWRLSPATKLPWTLAEVNSLVATGGGLFGLTVDFANIPAGSFAVTGLWANVTTARDNRLGYSYEEGQPRSGWSRHALTAAIAEAPNTSYGLLIYALRGRRHQRFTVPILWDPTAVIQDDPAQVGEHRRGTFVKLAGPSGLIVADQMDVPGTFIPFLLEQSGTILNESQPYVEISREAASSAREALAPNRATELTTTLLTTTYAGVSTPLWWGVPGVKPASPFVVEVRYGAGAQAGGGTLLATASFYPDANPSYPGVDPQGADVFIKFDGGNVVAPASTKLFLFAKSTSPANIDWAYDQLRTRSDLVGGGTTAANVNGQTQGGTTDVYTENNVADASKDLPMGLIVPPAAPQNPTAVVRSAT